MLTNNEINTLSLSPTKKDFVQIWNELLDVASKLSERWDPASTNESDPGIVILKALTGIADKLNYNIDKNTLEAFMPTAAQDDSMRKLCDMLGYNVKYYRSAETEVTIRYHNADPTAEESAALAGGLAIPKFTVISNGDQDISYFTVNQTPIYITTESPVRKLKCMEGQIVKCEGLHDNDVITPNQITETNRFYLPETMVAENGIFIYNAFNSELFGNKIVEEGTMWDKVDNLNIYPHGSKIYKFGFDSYEQRPYIEFPDDYSSLFNEGIFIYYTRTSGANGNISARTLTQLELPTGNEWSNVAAESFSVENMFAATSGADVETIKQAYNGFKKTVGTFETLVTCRDYMNKIYLMMDDYNRPCVSNALVTDIRNDLNRSITICSCDDSGIFYKETARSVPTEYPVNLDTISGINITVATNRPIFHNNAWHLTNEYGMELHKEYFITAVDNNDLDINDFNEELTGELSVSTDGYWLITQETAEGTGIFNTFTTNLPAFASSDAVLSSTVTTTVQEPAIDHFELVLYPFKSYNQLKSNSLTDVKAGYDASFKYTDANFDYIVGKIEDDTKIKTIAHSFISPNAGDIVSINNYYKLNATVATTTKLTEDACDLLIENIKVALANSFNMRELDFGEEIPFDSIIDVIEKADSKIKLVSLNEPALYTTYSVYEGKDSSNLPIIKEYAVASKWLTEAEAEDTGRFNIGTPDCTFNTNKAKEYYNKLAVRNILAGRVPLFKYSKTFNTSFTESTYQVTTVLTDTDEKPEELVNGISSENPFIMMVKDDCIYTGRWNDGNVEYTKTSAPETEQINYENSILTEVNGSPITDIETHCTVYPAEDLGGAPGTEDASTINDVKLQKGEFIKFRAPNYTTIKTYPAYVNYHLALNKELLSAAETAKAFTLLELLDKDRLKWTPETTVGWQKALDFFSGSTVITPLRQSISKYSLAVENEADTCSNHPTGGNHEDDGTGKCKHCDKQIKSSIQKGPITIDVESSSGNNTGLAALYTAIEKSGCIKLLNFKPILTWTDEFGDTIPGAGGPDLPIELNINNPFITSSEDLEAITNAITNKLNELVSMTKEDGSTPVLPTECGWTLTFNFEYMPFTAGTLSMWEAFAKSGTAKDLFGFSPVLENGIVFWRAYGEGYNIGKYIIKEDYAKLRKFTSSYFGNLPQSSYLSGIYVVENLGKDQVAAVVENDEEYELKTGEYLYIEYTPATSTDDGTTQTLDAVTEVHGQGTVIRPKGFEVGLMDSSVYASLGNSSFKTVTFETAYAPTTQIDMFRFSANEQVEIREPAKVSLTKNAFKGSSGIYYYKNFKNKELEYPGLLGGERSYILQDGEYIFYTDSQQVEYAYYTTGTKVTISGRAALKRCEEKDLSDILENGPQEIPWQYLALTDSDSLTFQEYKYITLGEGDTLKSLTMCGSDGYLSGEWQYCDNVKYSTASSSPDEELKLPPVDTSGSGNLGCGWEACSTLELDVSKNTTQTLRNDGKVLTSITISNKAAGDGDVTNTANIVPEPGTTISFKTNLLCQSGNSKINIEDVYLNKDKEEGFELKLFTKSAPKLIQTALGKTIPYEVDTFESITNWQESDSIQEKDALDLWRSVDLLKLRPTTDVTTSVPVCDNAILLQSDILSNTYGIFSIYIDYHGTERETWIELLPGTDPSAVTLFHLEELENSFRIAPSTDVNTPTRIYLNKGINCVRVNKTTPLFIKTAAESSGVLYFDDIRLVSFDSSENLSTYGLNLDQLGYFTTSDIEVLDSTAQETVKAAYVAETLATLDKYKAEEEHKFVEVYNGLREKSTDLLAAANFATDIINEVNYIKESNSNVKSLFSRLLTFSEELKKKNQLLSLLKTNKNTAELVDQASAIINSLDSADASKTKVLNALEHANTAIKNVKFTEKEILADFKVAVNNDSISAVLEEAIRIFEQQYDEQLASLTRDIKNIENSTTRAAFIDLISELSIDNLTAQNELKELNSALEELMYTVETDYETTLNTVHSFAVQGNYDAMLPELFRLKTLLTNDKISLYIDEIHKAIEALDYEQASVLVDKLTTTGSVLKTEAVSALETLITSVNTATDDNRSTILSNIASLREKLNNYHSSSIMALQGIMADCLDTVTKSTSNDENVHRLLAAKTLVESLKDARAADIYTKVDSLSSLRSTTISTFEAVKNTTEETLSNFLQNSSAVEAVYKVWPQYMYDEANTVANKYITYIEDLFNNSATATRPSNELADRPALAKAINISSFNNLLEQADIITEISSQNNSRKQLIEDVYGGNPVSAEGQNILEALKDSGHAALINSIYNKINQDGSQDSDGIVKKTVHIQELKNELAASISLDSELLKVCANRLNCATLLSFEDFINNNSVYNSSLSTAINEILLLIKTNQSDIAGLLTIIENMVITGKGWLDWFDEDSFASVSAMNSAIKELAAAKDSALIAGNTESFSTVYLSEDILDLIDDGLDSDLKASMYEATKNTWAYADSLLHCTAQELYDRLDDPNILAYEKRLIAALHAKLTVLENQEVFKEELKDIYRVIRTEEQLLAELRATDINNEFFYTVPIDPSLAIDFNESNSTLNTLLNPATNYDINNINNNFVISKLDIDYLSTGIQIARASRIN